MQKRLGRPRAKRSDPNYTQVSGYIRKDVHMAVKLQLLEDSSLSTTGRMLELSVLIEGLLADYARRHLNAGATRSSVRGMLRNPGIASLTSIAEEIIAESPITLTETELADRIRLHPATVSPELSDSQIATAINSLAGHGIVNIRNETTSVPFVERVIELADGYGASPSGVPIGHGSLLVAKNIETGSK